MDRKTLMDMVTYAIAAVIVNIILMSKPGFHLGSLFAAAVIGAAVGLWRKQPILGAFTLAGSYVTVVLVISQLI